ncbi:hypothetical protein SGRIM128S_04002 [Streptomyces griseomycini]
MFSRRNRRPTSPELLKSWDCLDAGDVPGCLRELRRATRAPLAQVALVVGRAALTTGFDDLHEAATAVAKHPDQPRALYDYGYACVERGVSYLAIPALREALRLSSGSPTVLRGRLPSGSSEGGRAKPRVRPTRGSTEPGTRVVRPAGAVRRSSAASEVSR